MQIIIELDGPVIDVEPVYWAAYSRAAGELGLARKHRPDFWRLVRRGAGAGEMLAGARPRHVQRFCESFAALLEDDESWSDAVAQAGVADELRGLRAGQHVLTLVTLGRNAGARQQRLDAHDLAVHFTRMARLAIEPYKRTAQLKELTENHTRVLVAAACEPLVKCANEAGLTAVDVSNGPCSARRLTQAGAALTFGGLNELSEEIARGGRNLLAAGLLPGGTGHAREG